MRDFAIYFDMTVTNTAYITAENQEQAIEIFENGKYDLYDFPTHFMIDNRDKKIDFNDEFLPDKYSIRVFDTYDNGEVE